MMIILRTHGVRSSLVRFLAITCLLPTASIQAWSSRSIRPGTYPIHQMAIQKVCGNNFSSNDIVILQAEQLIVDYDQSPTQSYEHSMTGLEKNHDKMIEFTNYIRLTEDLIHTNLATAISCRGASHDLSVTNLGKILHAMEDATSPAHEKFQFWAYNESLWAKAKHVFAERLYPSDLKSAGTKSYQARLEGAVHWALDLYAGKTNAPAKFFNAQGELEIPPGYLGP